MLFASLLVDEDFEVFDFFEVFAIADEKCKVKNEQTERI